MKTRNIIAILAALPIVAGFTGCKSDEELTAKPTKEILIVEDGKEVILRSGDELKDVNVTANCSWQVSEVKIDLPGIPAENLWTSLSVQPQHGDGNGTLIIMSDQNTDTFDRQALVTLKTDGGLIQTVNLRQKSGDPTINISAKAITFSAKPDGAKLLTIESNSDWNIQMPAGVSWMHVDKTSHNNTTGTKEAVSINVTADPIMSDATRTSSFTIHFGGSSAEVIVSQDGMNSEDIFLHAGTEQMGFSAEGGEQMLWVESNAEWNAYIPSSVTWLHVEGMHDSQHSSWSNATGVGNGELRIYCEPNNSTLTRLTAIVLIAGTKNPQQVVVLVEQAGVGTPESTVTVGDLTSLYVADKSAEFRFSFTSDQEVIDYGLVYSRENREPTRWNAEVKTVGQGGFTRSVLGTLDNLEPNTTYYVRAYVLGKTGQDNFYYSPNVVTIRTSDNSREPGESDNPDPSLAPRR